VAVTIIVTVTRVLLVLPASNDGEDGIMALTDAGASTVHPAFSRIA
jgi:K+ transporter